MQTYPIIDEHKGDGPFAFEIDKAYVGPRTIALLLSKINGVTAVHAREAFSASPDIQVEFEYLMQPYVVWEPHGDSSRYWIGPKDPSRIRAHIGEIERVFRDHRPAFYRRVLGDIVSLHFIARLFRKR